VVFSPSCTVVSCGVVWIIFSVGEFYTFDVLLVVLVMVGLYHLWVFMLLFLVSDFLSRLSFLLGGGFGLDSLFTAHCNFLPGGR